MKNREVYVLREAVTDLGDGRYFYDRKEKGVGDYFYDSVISDLEALRFFAGIHSRKYGFYRMFSKRFPFAIYYEIGKEMVYVAAVLDMRRKPSWIRKKLGKGKS